jgi:hypothetical protein
MDKPLRHEEYMAMAETNRRLEEENAKLKQPAPKMRSKQLVSFFRRDVPVWLAIPAILLTLFVGSVVSASVYGFKGSEIEGKKERTTPCYFTRHRYDEGVDKGAQPWEVYHIYKSHCEGCRNETILENSRDDHPVEFKTKDGAWQFMKQWKLEACK